jgi:hypothetical protein
MPRVRHVEVPDGMMLWSYMYDPGGCSVGAAARVKVLRLAHNAEHSEYSLL